MFSCRPLFVGGITLKVEMLHKLKIWKWWNSKSHNPKPFERQIHDTAKHLLWLTLAVRYIAPLCICMATKYLKSTLIYLLPKSILLSWLLFLSKFLMFWVLAQNSTWFSTSFFPSSNSENTRWGQGWLKMILLPLCSYNICDAWYTCFLRHQKLRSWK